MAERRLQQWCQPWESGDLGDDVTVDMTSSSGFKEKNDCYCLARARKNMKNTKETVYHCYNSCEMFSQSDVSFSYLIYLLHSLPVFYHTWKNYKIGFEEKWGSRSPIPPCGLATGRL